MVAYARRNNSYFEHWGRTVMPGARKARITAGPYRSVVNGGFWVSWRYISTRGTLRWTFMNDLSESSIKSRFLLSRVHLLRIVPPLLGPKEKMQLRLTVPMPEVGKTPR